MLSDHADWPQLLEAIAATEAEHILCTHGSEETVIEYLRSKGQRADSLSVLAAK